MIKEITQFIASLSLGPAPGWAIGTDLFAGHVPVKNFAGVKISELPDGRYLAVLENAGGAVLADVGGVVTIGHMPPSRPADATYWPKYIEKAVQLLNRAKSYFIAHDDAEQLYEALHNTGGWNLHPLAGGPKYQAIVIDAYGPPAPIENPGASGLYIFSTNYTWKIEEASCGA